MARRLRVGKVRSTLCYIGCDPHIQNTLASEHYKEIESKIITYARENGVALRDRPLWITTDENRDSILVFKDHSGNIKTVGRVELVDHNVDKHGKYNIVDTEIYLVL